MRGRGTARWSMAVPALAALLATITVIPSALHAGGPTELADEPRAESVSVVDGTFEIMRPTGWNIARAGQGAEAAFRSASDEQAEIEVRISDGVAERRWERYWRAFDTDLQESGFAIVDARRRTVHAGQRGFRFEYEVLRGDDTYRLVVWHTHESDRAWVFSAFFLEERRSGYLQTFEDMLDEMQW